MTRSLLSLLAISCLTMGCPGDDSSVTDKVGDTAGGTGIPPVDEDNDGWLESDGDCDDNNPDVNPDADEICDGNDNNCNGEIDENGETEYYADSDGDGFGDANDSVMACEPEGGYVANSEDCDDGEGTVYPGADELCDGLDNDCDSEIDEDLTTTYYRDADGDGYGDPGWASDECTAPGEGWVTNTDDCNDAEPMAYLGATEACDGIDNDCNGIVDDGLSTTWYPDADADGYGDDSAAYDSCVDPGAGYLTTGGDCNDSEPLAYTGASEYCDDVDNDCNGLVDDSALDATAQIADDDGDGFGSATATTWACDPLVTNTWDCDDSDASNPQVVDDSASSSGADGSMTSPWTTIQEGIDNASMCVAVMAGNYYENINFNGSDISVFSTDGWASTVIDGGGAGSVVTFENSESSAAELDGFTIQNGGGMLDPVVVTTSDSSGTITTITYNSYYGGGVLVDDNAAPTLANLYITGNILPAYSYVPVSSVAFEYTYSYGGGIFVGTSSGMWLDNVTVDANWADDGGGVYGSSDSSFGMMASRVIYNGARVGGGYSTGGTLDLTNAIVAGNEATEMGGGANIAGGSSTWWNVTAVGNEAPSGAGVAATDGGSFWFYSSSISDSNVGEGVYADSTATFSSEYSNLYGNDGGDATSAGSTGNITADPMFVSWTDNGTDDDDLSLGAGSTLMNAGNPSSAYNDADGSRNDIGAYGGPGGGW